MVFQVALHQCLEMTSHFNSLSRLFFRFMYFFPAYHSVHHVATDLRSKKKLTDSKDEVHLTFLDFAHCGIISQKLTATYKIVL